MPADNEGFPKTHTVEDDTSDDVCADDDDTISRWVEVDASGMDDRDREVFEQLLDIYVDNFESIVQKNRDYGWSFLTTGLKLSQSQGAPIDGPVRNQAYGLLTRTGDKRERLIENIYGNGDAAVSDPSHVTAAECGNYYFLLSFLLDNPDLAVEVAGSE